MIDIAKPCIKILGSTTVPPRPAFSQERQFVIAQTMIQVFYAIRAFFCLSSLNTWSEHLSKINPKPLWPIFWLNYLEPQRGIHLILWFYLISGILSLIAIRWKFARIAIFLASLEFSALTNSFGKINHGGHILLFLSFIFIFLPDQWHVAKPKREVRAATLLLFSSCQVAILLTYTMSGFFKVVLIPIQAIQNQVHSLMPEALALQIAQRLVETDEISVLGLWLINHYYLAWPLMLGTIYLQFFSLWAAFRPSLHQVWGLSLILFHLATHLTMTISFWQNCLWLALFLLNSPFRPHSFKGKQILRDLPLVNLLFMKYQLV